MQKDFRLTFKDLNRDAERHAARFGKKKRVAGTPAIFGWDKSERAVFDAYVAAGADDAITDWLMRHRTYEYGTNAYFDETMARFRRERAGSRVSRLWRHVCARQTEHYHVLRTHRDLKGIEKQIAEAKERVLKSMREWRRCLIELNDDEGIERLDGEIADFEAGRRKTVSRKPDPRKIDRDLFWEIIGVPEQPLERAGERVGEIAHRLAGFSAAQIKVFDKLLWQTMQRLNHYDVWALAFMLQDGCSDDAFEAFRAWVILHGRKAGEQALDDPQTFLTRIETGGVMDGSSLLQVPAMAYDRRTGKALPPVKRPPGAVQGTPWCEKTVEESYPHIAARIAALRNGG